MQAWRPELAFTSALQVVSKEKQTVKYEEEEQECTPEEMEEQRQVLGVPSLREPFLQIPPLPRLLTVVPNRVLVACQHLSPGQSFAYISLGEGGLTPPPPPPLK